MLMQEYGTSASAVFLDTAFKIALDPLWLVGPVKAATIASRGGRLAEATSKLSPILEKLPGPLRKAAAGIGTPVDEELLLAGRKAVIEGDLAFKSTGEVGQTRRLYGLFRLTPKAKASQDVNDIAVAVSSLLQQHTSITSLELSLIGTALKSGRIDDIPTVYGNLFHKPMARTMGQRMNAAGLDFEGLASLKKPVLNDMKAWQAAPPEIRRGMYPTYEIRNAAVMNEIMDEQTGWLRKLNDYHGLDAEQPGWMLAVGNWVNSVKPWLSMFTLNTPRFVVTNVANHLFTLAGYDFGPRALRSTDWALNEASKLGFSPAMTKSLAKAPEQAIATNVGAGTGKFRILSPFVAMATHVDKRMGLRAMSLSLEKAYRWNWRFERQGGIVPDLTDDLVNGLGADATARFKGQILRLNPTPESWDGFEAAVKNNVASPTAMSFIMRKAAQEGWDEGRITEEVSKFGDSFLDHVDGILTKNQDDLPTLASELRHTQDDLLREVHTMRDYDHLSPLARETLVGRYGVDADALTRQWENAQAETIQRLLRAHGFSNEEVQDVFRLMDDTYSHLGSVRNDTWNRIYAPGRRLDQEVYSDWEAYYPMRNEAFEGMRKGIHDKIAQRNPKLATRINSLFDELKLTQQRVDENLRNTLKTAGSQPTDTIIFASRQDPVHNLFEAHFRFSEAQYAQARNTWMQRLGFEAGKGKYALAGEYPMVGDVVSLTNHAYVRLIDDMIENIDLVAQRTPLSLTPETQQAMLNYIDELRPILSDTYAASVKSSQLMYDFSIINYQRGYGIDSLAMAIYPYHFWPTRTYGPLDAQDNCPPRLYRRHSSPLRRAGGANRGSGRPA